MKVHQRPDEGTPETRYLMYLHQVSCVPSSGLWCTFIGSLVYLHQVSGVPSSGLWCTFIGSLVYYTRNLMKVHQRPDEDTPQT
jgi:hypothetical protein